MKWQSNKTNKPVKVLVCLLFLSASSSSRHWNVLCYVCCTQMCNMEKFRRKRSFNCQCTQVCCSGIGNCHIKYLVLFLRKSSLLVLLFNKRYPFFHLIVQDAKILLTLKPNGKQQKGSDSWSIIEKNQNYFNEIHTDSYTQSERNESKSCTHFVTKRTRYIAIFSVYEI